MSRPLILTRFLRLYFRKHTKNSENVLNENGDLLTIHAGARGFGVLVSENGLVRKSSTRCACGSKTTHKSRSTETKRIRFTKITPSQRCSCSCAWSSYSSCWSPGESGFETTMGPGFGDNRRVRQAKQHTNVS